MKKIFSFFVLVCALFSFSNVVFAAPSILITPTPETLANGTISPTISIAITNATFVDVLSENATNWTISVGSTGLTLSTITKTDPNNVNISFTGTAIEGILSITANADAIGRLSSTNTVNISVPPAPAVEITSFDTISDLNGGTTKSVTYSDATTVQAALPATVTANSGAATVPVTSWTDTDTYNPLVAGSYTFTAVLGAIPSGFLNTGDYTATIEVVIYTPVVEVINNTSSGTSAFLIAKFQAEQLERAKSVGLYIPDVSGQTTFSIKRIIKSGMNGTDIKDLQIYLNTHGYSLSSTGAGSLGHETNYFGAKTKSALISFQKANGLTPDGIVGKMTQEKLKSILSIIR